VRRPARKNVFIILPSACVRVLLLLHKVQDSPRVGHVSTHLSSIEHCARAHANQKMFELFGSRPA